MAVAQRFTGTEAGSGPSLFCSEWAAGRGCGLGRRPEGLPPAPPAAVETPKAEVDPEIALEDERKKKAEKERIAKEAEEKRKKEEARKEELRIKREKE